MRTIETEVIRPFVHPRMKKADKLAGLRIYARDVWTLVAIAMRTSQGQIGWLSLASVLPGDDVVDLKRQQECELRNAAILATFGRSFPDLPSQFPIHCSRKSGS